MLQRQYNLTFFGWDNVAVNRTCHVLLTGLVKMILYTFCLLLQTLLELGSKSTSLSSGFSDVIKAALLRQSSI